MDIFRNYLAGCLISASIAPAFAMELMGDEFLSNAIAQDGISATLFTQNGITGTLAWVDRDGLDVSSQPGAVVFGNGTPEDTFRFSKGKYEFTVDIDGGNAVTSEASKLNLNVKLPEDFSISTGTVYVANKSRADMDNMKVGSYTNKIKIMNDMHIQLAGLEMNIQLGHQAQGAFMVLNGTVSDGIKISNLDIYDDSSVGNEFGIGFSNISIKDNNSQDFTFGGAHVDISRNGLFILTSPDKKVDIRAENMTLGALNTAPSIGAVALIGLDVGSKAILISGH